MSTKPAVAATAAELAAEIVEDDTELFEGGEAVATTAAVSRPCSTAGNDF